MSAILKQLRCSVYRYPILSNCVIYGSFYVAAELSQQILTKKVIPDNPAPIDKHALLRYSIFGVGISGPIVTYWYRWIDKKWVGKTPAIVVKKCLIDQFGMVPQLYILFFVTMSIMEGKKDIFEECREKFPKTFATSCIFWLPAQILNFWVVPPVFRVTYVSVCSFIWINILCYIKRQDYKQPDVQIKK